MVKEFTYEMQVEQLSKKTKIPVGKARKFIKEYRRLLKKRLKEGKKVDIVGIASIWLTVRSSVEEVFEEIYGYEEQVKDLANELEIEVVEAHHLLKTYLRMLFTKLRMGYLVKIPGVFWIRPDQFDEETLGYVTRISPTLDKPDKYVLKIRHLYGDIEELELDKDKMIFRLEVKDSLGVPSRIQWVGEEGFEIQYVDDSVLG